MVYWTTPTHKIRLEQLRALETLWEECCKPNYEPYPRPIQHQGDDVASLGGSRTPLYPTDYAREVCSWDPSVDGRYA